MPYTYYFYIVII
ncbi:hypothetical protein FG05_35225 [Fusarium graminearum]|nr:hypothetical protein FG05_35225 [Fusarium graminearum]